VQPAAHAKITLQGPLISLAIGMCFVGHSEVQKFRFWRSPPAGHLGAAPKGWCRPCFCCHPAQWRVTGHTTQQAAHAKPPNASWRPNAATTLGILQQVH